MSCFIRFGNVGGSGGNIWIFGRTLPGGWRSFWVVRWRESRTPEGEDIGSGCCGGGVIQLRLRERALLRQGQLSEPQASSGPAAMLLAISQNLSCIPRRSPCPGRYPLPLAFGFPPTFRSLNCILLTDFLPRPISSPSSVRFALRLHTKKSGIFSHPKDTGLLSAISWK